MYYYDCFGVSTVNAGYWYGRPDLGMGRDRTAYLDDLVMVGFILLSDHGKQFGRRPAPRAQPKSTFEFVPRDTEEFKFNQNLNSNLYREIPRNLSFSILTSWLKSPHHSGFRFAFRRVFRVSSSRERAVSKISESSNTIHVQFHDPCSTLPKRKKEITCYVLWWLLLLLSLWEK